MKQPPTRPPAKGQAVRYTAAALLVALGLYVAYEIHALSGPPMQSGQAVSLPKGASSTSAAALLTTCAAAPNRTLQRMYPKDPALGLHVFTFDADTVSKELVDHTKRQFSLGHHLTHSFYAKTLCSTGPPCRGIVLDVGAFIGTHALVLAKLGYSVHAFEPQALAVDLLRCSAAANGLNVTVLAEGVSNAVGKECFIVPMLAAMHQAMTAPKVLSRAGCEAVSFIPVTTLDHYWATVLSKQQVAFIKIDVEGHEDYVLEGASAMMAAAPPPYVLVEYYPHLLTLKNATAASLLSRVFGYGYRVYDCNKKVEVLEGPEGEKVLRAYSVSTSLTDLLLVHKSAAPRGSLKGKYECAY